MSASAEDTQEHRVFDRDKIHQLFDVVDSDSGTKIGHLKDLSKDGMRLLSKSEFEVGQCYNLEILVEGATEKDYRIAVVAQCRWIKDSNWNNYFEYGFQMDAYLGSAFRDLTAVMNELKAKKAKK